MCVVQNPGIFQLPDFVFVFPVIGIKPVHTGAEMRPL